MSAPQTATKVIEISPGFYVLGVEDPSGNFAIASTGFYQDESGNIVPLPPNNVDLVPLKSIAAQAASTDFAAFTATYSGTATVLLSLSTASTVLLMATPSGGTEATLGTLNSGQAVAASEPYSFDFPISAGAAYAFQLGTAQTGNLYVHVKGATMR